MKKLVISSLLAGAAGAFILAGGPVTAAAAETQGNCATFDQNGNITSVVPNCTETLSMRGGDPQQFPSPNPCTGDPGIVTLYITHQIFHLNVNGAGDVWATGTQNGTATFTSTDGGPDYSGSWSSWFGVSLNKQNAVTTDTLNVVMRDAAGDIVSMHQVDHMRFDQYGDVLQAFSQPTLACG